MAPCCCLVKSWAGFSPTQLNKSGLLQHTAAWHSPGMGLLWGRWAWRGGSNSPLWERVEREANNKSDRVTEYTARRVVAVEDRPSAGKPREHLANCSHHTSPCQTPWTKPPPRSACGHCSSTLAGLRAHICSLFIPPLLWPLLCHAVISQSLKRVPLYT